MENTFGTQLGTDPISASVSHQHIYGFLFRIIWPLYAGRVFFSKQILYPQDLKDQLAQYEKTALVSSPAYLKRLPGLMDIGELSGKLISAFSSGGPLQNVDAVAFFEKTQMPVIEVFGSTETGGIGYRSQKIIDQPPQWRLLPDVSIQISPNTNTLMVNSPYTGIAGWYQTRDLAIIHDKNQFEIRGRADKIVKIAEKRVSLTEVENQLNQLSSISDSIAVVLKDSEDILAVVAVLSQTGQQQLEQSSKLDLVKQIKTELSDYFEPVLVPKKWRFLTELPVNKSGKLPIDTIRNLFK